MFKTKNNKKYKKSWNNFSFHILLHNDIFRQCCTELQLLYCLVVYASEGVENVKVGNQHGKGENLRVMVLCSVGWVASLSVYCKEYFIGLVYLWRKCIYCLSKQKRVETKSTFPECRRWHWDPLWNRRPSDPLFCSKEKIYQCGIDRPQSRTKNFHCIFAKSKHFYFICYVYLFHFRIYFKHSLLIYFYELNWLAQIFIQLNLIQSHNLILVELK